MFKQITASLVLSLTIPAMVQGQMTDVKCDDSSRMKATLSDVLGAERQGVGLRDPETMLEVWVTQQSGDWIIVQSYANGTSCIVAMGAHWEGALAGPA